MTRGRPRKYEEGFKAHNETNQITYYTLDKKREAKTIKKTNEERLLKAYNDIYQYAYGKDISWSYNNRLREMFKNLL